MERVTLQDGRVVELRPIRPEDADALATFHGHLSPETIRRRFFTAHPVLSPAEVHRFTNVDGEERLAIVATCDGDLVAVGRYEALTEPGDVEGAWVVRDDFQQVGLGRRLVHEIVEAARAHGKRRLLAETLAENVAMRRALLGIGLPVTMRFRGGVVEVIVTLDPAPAA